MSENREEEQLPGGHGATEEREEGSLSDSSAAIASNLGEMSNGVNQLPSNSTTHTNQGDVTVDALSGNATATMNQVAMPSFNNVYYMLRM